MKRSDIYRASSWIILLTEISFAFAFLHMLVMVTVTPAAAGEGLQDKGDFFIHVLQALAGLILNALPLLLNRRTPFFIPRALHALFSIFLLMALNLGSIYGLYGVIGSWDLIQHGYSSALVVLAGSGVLWSTFARMESGLGSTPRYAWLTSGFGFCVAAAVGVFWEFYEWTVDSLIGQNSQQFMTSDGTPLLGQAALRDTMGDLLTNTAGAFAAAVFVFYFIRSDNPLLQDLLVRIRKTRSA